MSRNIITYDMASRIDSINGVYIKREQGVEISKVLEEKDKRIAELKKANESFTLMIKEIQKIIGKEDICVNDIKGIGQKVAIEKLEELLFYIQDTYSIADIVGKKSITRTEDILYKDKIYKQINSIIKSLKGEKKMSREILFRGFSPNGKGKETIWFDNEEIKGDWKFGYYGKTKRRSTSIHAPNTFFDIHYIMVEEERNNGETYLVDYEILPYTLSQFTGLLDADNNKIWENDIVVHRADNRQVIVKYKDGMFNLLDEGYQLSASKNFKVIGNRWEKEWL